jgi:alpha-galactosidase
MQHPKVVILGAGSLFFGRQAIWQMVHSESLRTGTLGLVDTDETRLKKMATLAQKVIDHEQSPLKLEAATDRKNVLDGADFVVLSFAKDTVKYRGIDCAIAEKYGIRMCSGDTIGPGGVFRTLREFPVVMECCRDIEAMCPDAWVINYINPTAAHGVGLKRFVPQLKTFALCDGLHMPHVKNNYARRAGILGEDETLTPEQDAKFDFRIAGPNHFTWLLKAEYDGRDVTPPIAEALKTEAANETDGGDTGAKARYNASIGYALYQAFGYIPTCVGHTKEYVRFWQGLGKTPEPIPPLSIWETDPRYQRHDEMWKQVDDFNSGATPIGGYMTEFGPDHATDIIENMVGNLGKPFFVNTTNRGAISNLQDDDFVELLCDFGPDGPEPRPVGEAPVGLRGMWAQVLDTHELSAMAAVTGDRDLLRRALLVDPIVSSLADAEKIIDETLAAQRDALPEYWYT